MNPKVVASAGFQAALALLGVLVIIAFVVVSMLSRQTDIQVYRMGGSAIRHGGDLYSAVDPNSDLPFTYTPFAAVLFVPVSILPWRLSQGSWTVLVAVALYLFCAVSCSAVRGSAVRGSAVRGSANSGRLVAYGSIAGAALLLEPIRRNFELGQINIVLALLIAVDLFGRRARLPRGVLIGVAAGVKLTPLIFLPYLLVTRRWRSAGWAAVAFLGTIAAGFAVSFRSSSIYWGSTVLDVDHVGGVPFVGNQSLLGLLSRLMSGADRARPLYLPLAGAVMLIGLVVCGLLHHGGRRLLADLTCALTGLLVSPISWSHHWVWLVPVLLYLGCHPDRPAWGRCGAIVGGALFTLAPIWWVPSTGDVEFTHHGWQLVAGNCYVGAGLLLFTLLAIHALVLAVRMPAVGGVRAPVDSDSGYLDVGVGAAMAPVVAHAGGPVAGRAVASVVGPAALPRMPDGAAP
ncbi:glycosyltransferase 87 family protein [Frankia sp. Ag45/Mut15]|uniref:Glycosyltransferase 87 family protein n=1 Tax=Frankia umida TaxID=573489 RepID=A0ABT0JY88_9ACTN|nr:glycosyltransferase 87 family protein [Frankia umida]